MAQHDFTGAHRLSGDTNVGLEANAEIGSSTPGTRAADNLIPGAQGDGSSSGSGQVLRAFGDGADSRL
jgi:hypothetical protein